MSEKQAVIRVLSDDVVDQIAAGEVVERPASVVKELVENALDARARRIRVDVRDGGIAWLQVGDDGVGMQPADARLALRRHATSKLGQASDLERIASYGFRGEALPAIASVSNFRMVTRPAGTAEATEIRIAGGRLLGEQHVGAAVGTRIEVADLFESVPARRKFLKKPSTEWAHVIDGVGRLALALPEIHFEIRRDERRPQVWPATADPLDRIAAVLSEDEAAALLKGEAEMGETHLEAFVSSPEHTRPNARSIRLFVNGRPVQDNVLRGALLQAYRDVLPRGRYPSAILFLRMAPGSVDVNVHPAKREVRFAAPQEVHQLVRRTVRDAMERRTWLGFEGTSGAPQQAPALGSGPPVSKRAPDAAGEAEPWTFREGAKPLESPSEGALSDARSTGAQPRPFFSGLPVLGQLHASYLVLEGPEGLLLVDQHAAHERVLYERLREQWSGRGVERQALLMPETVELGAVATAVFAQSAELCANIGFEVDAFGDSTVVVRGIPALLSGQNPAALVRELASEWNRHEGGAGPRVEDTRFLGALDAIFASLACHSARRAGDRMPAAEQASLMRDLDGIAWSPTCPHGRPVASRFDLAEIERRFGRR